MSTSFLPKCERLLERHLTETSANLSKKRHQEEDAKVYPIVWGRIGTGFRIEHLQSQYYVKVMELIKNHYLNNEIISKSLGLKNSPKSVESFLERVLFTMKDNASIVLLDENTNDSVVGVLLLRIVNKLDFGRIYSRMAFDTNKQQCGVDAYINFGPIHKKIVELHTALLKQVDIFEEFRCENFLRYYLLCIHDNYRGNQLGSQLMQVGLLLAGYLRIPIATGIFSDYSMQTKAKKLGFEVVREVAYDDWLSKENDQPVIKNPGVLNKTCALMVAEVPPPYISEINRSKEKVEKKKGKGKKKKGKKK